MQLRTTYALSRLGLRTGDHLSRQFEADRRAVTFLFD